MTLVKKSKGHYSKYKSDGAIPGFLFREESQRDEFMKNIPGVLGYEPVSQQDEAHAHY